MSEHHQTIPSTHGWYHCEPVLECDDTVVEIYEAPVIAWVITFAVDDATGEVRSRYADAVIADAAIGNTGHQYFKRPDGWYVDVEGGCCTRAELMEVMQADIDRDRRLRRLAKTDLVRTPTLRRPEE